ncbi:MAG: hypothetical protein COB76_03760 [Alphaproteobacteria bacterium]|nr:MAG: hypothetical protein COB76_03760 [Alphaproteobacteria bacterium]
MLEAKKLIQRTQFALAGHITTFKGTRAPMQELTVKNPLNVMEAAQPVINRILEIKSADPKAKIIVNVGEYHTIPTHTLMNAAILQGLINLNLSTIHASEFPHNTLLSVHAEQSGTKRTERNRKILEKNDPDGIITLKANTVYRETRHTIQTTRMLHHFCLENHIPSVFTDTSRQEHDGETVLDTKDNQTKKLCERNKGIDAVSSRGMALRNHFMTQNQIHALKNKDVLVQHVGAAHIFGQQEKKHLTNQSLSGVFNAQNHDSIYQINLYLLSHRWSTSLSIPGDIPLKQMENSFVIRGFDLSEFDYNSSSQIILSMINDDAREILLAKEDAYIDSIITNSGDFTHIRTPTAEQKHKYGLDVDQFIRDMRPKLQ